MRCGPLDTQSNQILSPDEIMEVLHAPDKQATSDVKVRFWACLEAHALALEAGKRATTHRHEFGDGGALDA